jgi:hypothetical protein
MTTHQLATLLDHVRSGFGESLKTPAQNEFADVSTAFRELPDQPLKELVKQLRKAATPQPGPKASGIDLPTLIARIRAVRESPLNGEPVAIDLDGAKLNNNQLKDVLKAFNEKSTNTLAGNLTKVRQLIRPGAAVSADVATTATVAPDGKAIEEGLNLYNSLLNDSRLSIPDLRAGFEPLRTYPKPVVEEISRRLGYTPAGSHAAILDRLLNNLEGIKLSQHRADRIMAGTGS